MHRLFVYGTLKEDNRVHAVTGKTFPKTPARLSGFRLVQSKGFYPYIVPSEADVVEGLLLEEVDEASLRRIDEYEGEGGFYRRVAVRVSSVWGEVEAFVYVGSEHKPPLATAAD